MPLPFEKQTASCVTFRVLCTITARALDVAEKPRSLPPWGAPVPRDCPCVGPSFLYGVLPYGFVPCGVKPYGVMPYGVMPYGVM